jgi:hypothetical protein
LASEDEFALATPAHPDWMTAPKKIVRMIRKAKRRLLLVTLDSADWLCT